MTGFIRLDDHMNLFRDPESFLKFLHIFRDALQGGGTPTIVAQKEPMKFHAVSDEFAKAALADRILRRLAENPDTFSELKESLEDDAVIE